jgi:hypothetical protein
MLLPRHVWECTELATSQQPKSQDAQSALDPVETDFSLRPNGRTYIEVNGEATQVLERIQRSSASVIGIAGVRGAGKSSLSKKVLDACSARGFFTLLIPSPISYEPREFLLAIFQRIVESAMQSMTAAIEGSEDLVETGRERARQVRRMLIVLSVGIFFSVATAAGFQLYYYYDYTVALQQQSYQKEAVDILGQKKEALATQLKYLDARISEAAKKAEATQSSEEGDRVMRDLAAQRGQLARELSNLDLPLGSKEAWLRLSVTLIASALVYLIAVVLAFVVYRLRI